MFSGLESYGTAANDVWSLGVILVNLTCGRNPWRQAHTDDETFRAYVRDHNFLRNILPISHATNNILKGLFALDPRMRPSLREIRKAILDVDSFTMSEEELRHAHSAAQAAAQAVRGKPSPARPKTPAPRANAPQPIDTSARPPPAVVPSTGTGHFHQPAPIDGTLVGQDGEYAPVQFEGINGQHIQQHQQQQQPQWSQHSAFADIDRHVLDQIDYRTPPQHQQQQQQPQPQQVHKPTVRFRTAAAPQQYISVETPSLVGSGPCALGRVASCSSSSGDASLPPTPEFNPADKTTAGMAAQWAAVNGAKGVELKEPDILHMTPDHVIRNGFHI